jgi:hypothetical protein
LVHKENYYALHDKYKVIVFIFSGIINGIIFHYLNNFSYFFIILILSFSILSIKKLKFNKFKFIYYLFFVLFLIGSILEPKTLFLPAENISNEYWFIFKFHVFLSLILFNCFLYSNYKKKEKEKYLRFIDVFGNFIIIFIILTISSNFLFLVIYTILDTIERENNYLNYIWIRDIGYSILLFLSYFFSIKYFKDLKLFFPILINILSLFLTLYLAFFLVIFFGDLDFLNIDKSILFYLNLHTFFSFIYFNLVIAKKNKEYFWIDKIFIIFLVEVVIFSIFSIIGGIKFLYILKFDLTDFLLILINLIILSNMIQQSLLFFKFLKGNLKLIKIKNLQGRYLIYILLYSIVISLFLFKIIFLISSK